MPEHVLKTKGFTMALSLDIYPSDIKSPENTIMTVLVKNDSYSAVCSMDIDIKQFAAFARDLKSLYDTLNGTATIKEPYGYEKYISFSAENGYVEASGYLCDDMKNFELKFSESLDQTFLKGFVYELFDEYRNVK